jgi:hypothetical protein
MFFHCSVPRIRYFTVPENAQMKYRLKKMHSTEHCKFINAHQTKVVKKYKNTKWKLLKANAAIWFNKICRT